MKISYIAILILGIILSGLAEAKIYRYVDDNGQAVYTNDLSSVPKSNRAEASEQEEISSTSSSTKEIKSTGKSSSQALPSIPPPREEGLRQKQQMETEYKELLKEKEALDNNKTFQKRRKKRKYQNRHHIKELEEKEKQIVQHMTELEQKLMTFK